MPAQPVLARVEAQGLGAHLLIRVDGTRYETTGDATISQETGSVLVPVIFPGRPGTDDTLFLGRRDKVAVLGATSKES